MHIPGPPPGARASPPPALRRTACFLTRAAEPPRPRVASAQSHDEKASSRAGSRLQRHTACLPVCMSSASAAVATFGSRFPRDPNVVLHVHISKTGGTVLRFQGARVLNSTDCKLNLRCGQLQGALKLAATPPVQVLLLP